ncbi:MAG: PdaC/SigV domain-containing protein [Flavobacterium sp.]
MKKILLFILLYAVFTSCKNDKEFSFEEKTYQKILLETCVEDNCTEIKIITAEITTPQDEVSTKINNNNLVIINDLLSFEDEKKEATTYDDIVISFTNAYTALVKQFPKATIPWQATATNTVTFYSDNLLSYSLEYYLFTGGANGFNGEKAIHYNPKTGEQYTNEQLFKNYTEFKQVVLNKLKEANKSDKTSTTKHNGVDLDENSFSLPENIFIYEDSLVLNFTNSELGAMSNKDISVSFTKEEITPYLNFDLVPKANTNK